MDYLERLRSERPVLYWVVLLVGFWLGFQLLLTVAQLLLGSFALPAWAPVALVLAVLVLIARRQQRSR
jgi:lipopolysaccharide export LptBFGC system permease protein LptF